MTHESPKRRKTTRACDGCRNQKKRCDGTLPCASCVRNGRKCTFLGTYTRGRAVTPPPSAAALSNDTPTEASYPQHQIISPPISQPLDYPSEEASGIRQIELPFLDSTRTLGPRATLGASHSGRLQAAVSEPSSDEVLVDGHFVGPGSAHSWLRQAWSFLAKAKQNIAKSSALLAAPDPDTCLEDEIFSHGDRCVTKDGPEITSLYTLAPETIELLVNIYWDRSMATYRFVHKPTYMGWLAEMLKSKNDSCVSPIRAAIVTLGLAVGAAYLSDAERAQLSRKDTHLLEYESLYRLALKRLKQERGAPSIESVQARLLQVHCLATSARPNKAWYTFGTVVQLTLALGLHRNSLVRQNAPGMARELRRRTFWAVYKTDKALSIALGRPSLLRDEFITQELPEVVDDEKLFSDRIESQNGEDCIIEADLLQVELARIVSQSMREYYETDDDKLIQMVVNSNMKLANWKARLPPFLSGIVKPAMLLPIYGRQATLLKLFHLHAIMFINRPLLLKSFSNTRTADQDYQIEFSIDASNTAASEIAQQAVLFDTEGQAFQAFWFTQIMTFNAVSILYLNLLRLVQYKDTLTEAETETMRLAERAQKSLAVASKRNAPGQRYEAILEQLRLELEAQLGGTRDVSLSNPRNDPGVDVKTQQNTTQGLDWELDGLFPAMPSQEVSMFWPQFDGLPQDFGDWLEPGHTAWTG